MTLKRVSYTEDSGKKVMVLLPQEAPEEEAQKGILIGPPEIESLGLSEEATVRLHNELFERGILTPKDALRGRDQIMYALQATFKVDVDRIVELYVGEDYKNARHESLVPESVSVESNERTQRPRRRR